MSVLTLSAPKKKLVTKHVMCIFFFFLRHLSLGLNIECYCSTKQMAAQLPWPHLKGSSCSPHKAASPSNVLNHQLHSPTIEYFWNTRETETFLLGFHWGYVKRATPGAAGKCYIIYNVCVKCIHDRTLVSDVTSIGAS